MSPVDAEVRCDRCDGLVTPAQRRADASTVRCTFCAAEVALRDPPRVATEQQPGPPAGWTVTTLRAPAPPADDGPYRSRVASGRAGVRIEWSEDRRATRAILATVSAGLASAAAVSVVAWPTAIAATLVGTAVAGGVVTRTAWTDRWWVRIDERRLAWPAIAASLRRVERRLAADDVERIEVRDETDPTRAAGVEGSVERHAVYAHDRRGRAHRVAVLGDRRHARWLRRVITTHLEPVDRDMFAG